MRPIRLLALASSLSFATLHAQTYTAARIEFSQPGTFSQQQLEDAVAIHKGTAFTAADLGKAAQRLVDTGYFEDVGASLDGKIIAITVKFETKPATHLLPVGFDNFVWLTHPEIEAAIRTRLPLFNGYLPEVSGHVDDINAALTQALAAKSITAKVISDTYEPTLRHPQRVLRFHITSPSIRVANVKLGGVTPDLVPLVQRSVNSTARTLYSEGPADETTADRILAPLLDAGYVQASLTDATPTPAPAENGTVGVVLSAKLDAGDILRLSAITYSGSALISSETFSKAAKLHPGDVVARRTLLETLAPIDAAYRRQGFIDVVVAATPTFDAAAHQVAYTVQVEPGEVYTIHEVTPNNLDPKARADFDRYFLLKSGTVYNPEYVATFLKNNTALHSFDGYSAGFKAYADTNTHTVDLVITFVRSGG